MSPMRMVRDMVWAVLLGEALPRHGLGPDSVTVQCSVAGIWLKEVSGRRLAEHRGEEWWAPATLGTVEAIADTLTRQLDAGARTARRAAESELLVV